MGSMLPSLFHIIGGGVIPRMKNTTTNCRAGVIKLKLPNPKLDRITHPASFLGGRGVECQRSLLSMVDLEFLKRRLCHGWARG